MLITQTGHDERGGRIVEHVSRQRRRADRARPRRPDAPPPPPCSLDGTASASYDFDLGWALPHQELPAVRRAARRLARHDPRARPGQRARPGRPGLGPRACSSATTPTSGRRSSTTRTQAWRDVEALADRAHLVKLSDRGRRRCSIPAPTPRTSPARCSHGDRTELVLLTRGGDGLRGVRRAAWWSRRARRPRSSVVDTVGAGDAFMAATPRRALEDVGVRRLRRRAAAPTGRGSSGCCGRRARSPRSPARDRAQPHRRVAELRPDWPA